MPDTKCVGALLSNLLFTLVAAHLMQALLLPFALLHAAACRASLSCPARLINSASACLPRNINSVIPADLSLRKLPLLQLLLLLLLLLLLSVPMPPAGQPPGTLQVSRC